jgi:hypothetical protein
MNKGVIASQLRFTRGATSLEFDFSYEGRQAGTVKRLGRGKGAQWVVDGAPEYRDVTREGAVSRYLAANLTAVLPPMVAHRWVHTTEGDAALVYYCDLSQRSYQVTQNDQTCMACGKPIAYNIRVAQVVRLAPKEGAWQIERVAGD